MILGATLALVRSHNPDLSSRDKATILWFVLSTYAEPYKLRPCFKQQLADLLLSQLGLSTSFSRVRTSSHRMRANPERKNRILCI